MWEETSVINIFNKMSYHDRETENTDDEKIRKLYPDLEEVERIHSLRTAVTKIRAKNESETTGHTRASILLDIGRRLSEEAHRLSELQNFREKDYSLLVDSFYYNSSMCYQLSKNWIPHEYTILDLSSHVPFSVLGSVISAAFGVDCPVVVLYSLKNPWFLLFLKRVFSHTALPKHSFTLVPKCDENEREIESEGGNAKIIFFGSHSSATELYERNCFRSFSFVNPNHTAAIIFEFCDLSAAIDKIFYETWDKKMATIWGVSTVVVQESVYQKFLVRLKLRVDQLTDEWEGELIKNCIISEEDRHRETEANVPVLKVFCCRTANEGVGFLNSYQYYLGTSIWSENSSQALEVASKLFCNNIWINCHGIIEPSVPFQSSGNNGSVVFGGYEGILEYRGVGKVTDDEKMNYDPPKIQISIEETVLSAQKAFKKWLLMENKGMYLTKIATSLKNDTKLCDLYKAVTEVLSTKDTNRVPRSCNRNFYVIQEKLPIGVIAIILKQYLKWSNLLYLISTAIALGNAVILVLEESPQATLAGSLVDVFNTHLPKGLLSVIIENNERGTAISLASNSNIQGLWFDSSGEYLSHIRKSSSKSMKRMWSLPNLNEHFLPLNSNASIYQRECTRNKIIWLTKVDHFP